MMLNFDVAMATEFWQPGFPKFCLIFPINRIYFYVYLLIIALQLIYLYFFNQSYYNCYGNAGFLMTELR